MYIVRVSSRIFCLGGRPWRRGVPLLLQHESFWECIFVRAHALLMQYIVQHWKGQKKRLILFSTIIIQFLGGKIEDLGGPPHPPVDETLIVSV